MGISDLQQALHSVALKGSLDSFWYQEIDIRATMARTTARTTLVPTKENGLKLTLF